MLTASVVLVECRLTTTASRIPLQPEQDHLPQNFWVAEHQRVQAHVLAPRMNLASLKEKSVHIADVVTTIRNMIKTTMSESMSSQKKRWRAGSHG